MCSTEGGQNADAQPPWATHLDYPKKDYATDV